MEGNNLSQGIKEFAINTHIADAAALADVENVNCVFAVSSFVVTKSRLSSNFTNDI